MNVGYYEYGVADYTLPRRSNGLPRIMKHRVKVEIIDTSPLRTKAKLLEADIRGRTPGTPINVKTANIFLKPN